MRRRDRCVRTQSDGSKRVGMVYKDLDAPEAKEKNGQRKEGSQRPEDSKTQNKPNLISWSSINSC